MDLQDLREALATPDVFALLQKVIDDTLLDEYRKQEPLKGALAQKTWDTPTYFWNTRTKIPYAQGVTETPPTTGVGSVSPTQSRYVQRSVDIGHYQVNGDLGKFAIKTAKASISNLLDEEMSAALQTMVWTEAQFHIWGDALATAGSVRPQWDGFESQFLHDSRVRITPLAGAGQPLSLADLDNMIDIVKTKTAAPLPGDQYFFMTTEPAISAVSRLLLPSNRTVQSVLMKPMRDDGTVGHPVQTIEGGVEIESYRGIPMVASSLMSPLFKMSTVTAGHSGADGDASLGTAARYYTVEAIGQYGTSYCCAVVSTTPSASNHVTLSFAKPANLNLEGDVEPILLYRVYMGTASDGCTLYAIVSATDANDADVTVIQDNGNAVLANPGAHQVTGNLVGVVVGGIRVGNGVDIPCFDPADTSDVGYNENMWLTSRNPNYTVVPSVTEVESDVLANINARSTQYALIGDKCLAVRARLFAAKLMNFNTAAGLPS